MAYLGAVLWAVALTSLLLVALVLGAARNQRRSIEGNRRKRLAPLPSNVNVIRFVPPPKGKRDGR